MGNERHEACMGKDRTEPTTNLCRKQGGHQENNRTMQKRRIHVDGTIRTAKTDTSHKHVPIDAGYWVRKEAG